MAKKNIKIKYLCIFAFLFNIKYGMSKEKEKTSQKKQIRLDIKYRIDRGEPKQQIIEDLSFLYKDKRSIARQIDSIPSKAMKEKYWIFNYILASFLLAALIMDILLFFRLDWGWLNTRAWWQLTIHFNVIISLVLDSLFFVSVLMYRINMYSWIVVRALTTMVVFLVAYIDNNPLLADKFLLIPFGLILLSFVVGLLLSWKLCPPRIPKIIEVDIDGVEKIKKTILYYGHLRGVD
jgi:hypothetical protein